MTVEQAQDIISMMNHLLNIKKIVKNMSKQKKPVAAVQDDGEPKTQIYKDLISK